MGCSMADYNRVTQQIVFFLNWVTQQINRYKHPIGINLLGIIFFTHPPGDIISKRYLYTCTWFFQDTHMANKTWGENWDMIRFIMGITSLNQYGWFTAKHDQSCDLKCGLGAKKMGRSPKIHGVPTWTLHILSILVLHLSTFWGNLFRACRILRIFDWYQLRTPESPESLSIGGEVTQKCHDSPPIWTNILLLMCQPKRPFWNVACWMSLLLATRSDGLICAHWRWSLHKFPM